MRDILPMPGWVGLSILLLGALPIVPPGRLRADAEPAVRSAPANDLAWPTGEQLVRVLTLRDYNTRVVLFGTTMLGVSGGLVGVFLLLRRRSLVADVVSHTTLPGIAIAFLVGEAISPGSGKSTPALLAGAFVFGLIGMASTTAIVRCTRIKEDAAFAIVLSVFFGFGIALFTIIQSIPAGNAAGLGSFIYGKAASMIASDVWLIAWASLAVLIVFALLFKEWMVVSFDEEFAASQGWPILALDGLLLTLVTTVTVIGLQSVGMLLVVALMIIPATAARFWTYDLKRMTVVSAVLGGLSSVLGVLASALFPRLAAGAVIVLAGSTLFLVSFLFGTRRGVINRWVQRFLRDRRIARDHLLRALFECMEPRCDPRDDLLAQLLALTVDRVELLKKRSWSTLRLQHLIRSAERDGYVVDYGPAGIRFTERGASAACRVVRNHRLWELFLIEYADRSPSRVDRDADDIEHDLGPEIVSRLERLLPERHRAEQVPPSPHAIPIVPDRGVPQ